MLFYNIIWSRCRVKLFLCTLAKREYSSATHAGSYSAWSIASLLMEKCLSANSIIRIAEPTTPKLLRGDASLEPFILISTQQLSTKWGLEGSAICIAHRISSLVRKMQQTTTLEVGTASAGRWSKSAWRGSGNKQINAPIFKASSSTVHLAVEQVQALAQSCSRDSQLNTRIRLRLTSTFIRRPASPPLALSLTTPFSQHLLDHSTKLSLSSSTMKQYPRFVYAT
jgi:hypothetical protein